MKLTARRLVAFAAFVGLLLRRRGRRRSELGGRPGPPPAGVREPRRPVQPTGSGAATADPPQD